MPNLAPHSTSRLPYGARKRAGPIVSPRPGLLVCRKEGLQDEIAIEVPRASVDFTAGLRRTAALARRIAVIGVDAVTRSES